MFELEFQEEWFGGSVTGAGDVDGDGAPDVIVSGYGTARVYSGLHGSLIWELTGSSPRAWEFGYSCDGIGDVNKDGFDDIVVGVPGLPHPPGIYHDPGLVIAYSGKTGGELWRATGLEVGDRFGESVAGVGDMNRDGVPDVVVGAPGTAFDSLPWVGEVHALSGADGSLIWRADEAAEWSQYHSPWGRLGSSVASAGDMDRDGYFDVLVGAPGAPYEGRALVYSGEDGSKLLELEGDVPLFMFGSAVACAGDVNGDGVVDLVVGAPDHPAGPFAPGAVVVFSGATGEEIWRVRGQPRSYELLGSSVAGVGDVDRDGFADVIAGAPAASPNGRMTAGSAFVYSGRTGEVLWRVDGKNEVQMGFSVGGLGDTNADGFPDVIVGAGPHEIGGPVGTAFVFRYKPAFLWYGTGVEGTGRVIPRIGTVGEVPAIGNDGFQIRVTEGVGGSLCVIAGSLTRSETSLLGGTLYGDFLTPGMFVTSFLATTGPEGFPGVGTATLPLPVPNDPDLAGLTTHWQGFLVDPGSPLRIGVSHTGGLAVTLVPRRD